MEETVENGGVTIGHIFRTIFSVKWLALILAAAITLVGALSMYLFGKSREVYAVSFEARITGSGTNAEEIVFPDGKLFRYDAMVSYDNLEKVKASNDEFKDIDIETMYEKGDITIERAYTKRIEDSELEIYDVSYLMTAKTKYFKEKTIARDFLRELTQFPNKYLAEMYIDYNRYLAYVDDTVRYDVQLGYLSSQASLIQGAYENLIGSYGGNFVIKDGKTLSSYLLDLNSYLTNVAKLSQLSNEVFINRYVRSDGEGNPHPEAIRQYEISKFYKERELEDLNAAYEAAKEKYKDYVTPGSTILDIDALIATETNYENSRVALEREIADLKDFLDSTKQTLNDDLYDTIKDISARLAEFTKEYTEIASTVYTERTIVSYMNTGIIETDGGFGLLISGAVGLVAGLVIACIVAYIVGSRKQKKARIESNAGDASVYGDEIQLQVAAADAEEEKDKNK